MISLILSAITAIVGFLTNIFAWLSQKQTIESGRAIERSANLAKENEDLEREKDQIVVANKVRESTHHQFDAANNDSRLQDDGFRRD